MQFLLLFYLASSVVALKSPTLCPNDKGNEFVCAVIETVNKEDSYADFPSIADITIGQTGQADFYKSIKALEVLRGSLRTQTNTEALKTIPYSWFKILGSATGQLENAKSGTQKLVKSVASGLKSLQTAFEKITTANKKKVDETISKAKETLSQEIDQKALGYYSDEYDEAVEKCNSTVSKQVETLQDRTMKRVERMYDSLIDLTDQIGLCIQTKDTQGKCARTVQTKLNGLRSLASTSGIDATQFEKAGSKTFERDPCLGNALKRFDESVNKVMKTAPKKE